MISSIFKKNYTLLLLLVTIVLTSNNVFSQKSFTLYHLNETAQSNYLNPGFKQKNRFYLSLPLGMQNISVLNSGFKLADLIQTRPQDDSLNLTPSSAISKMAKLNFLNVEMSNEIFGFGFRLKKSYFSMNVTNRIQSRLSYSKDLFSFAFEGNGGDFLGKRAAFDGLGVDLMSYVEYGIGYNRDVNDKLTVGGRVKILSGIANVQTKKSQLGISTDANSFDLTIDGGYQLNTSNLDSSVMKDPTTLANSAFDFKNFGLALDLGASYRLTNKIEVNASLLDLGYIKWANNVTNYASNDFNYKFTGINLMDSLASDKLEDTLSEIFNQKQTHDTYSTKLRTKFYLGGKYQFNNFFSTSALLYNEIVASKYTAGISLSMNAKVNNWLNASVNYSAYGRSYNNIGFGLNLKGGPVQFYVMTDNIMAIINPEKAKHAQITFGFNFIVVGPKRDKDRIKEIDLDKVKVKDGVPNKKDEIQK